MDKAVSPDGLVEQQDAPPDASRHFSGLAFQIVRDRIIAFPPPEVLFHYASSAGLLGIVENNTLWFSNAMFLNDASESNWGIRIFFEVLDSFMEDKDAEEKGTAEQLKRAVIDAFNYYQPIVFCMSSENNLLNQWRDYGKDIVPYSISLSTLELTTTQYSLPVILSEVIYDVPTQTEMVHRLCGLLYARAKSFVDSEKYNSEDDVALLSGAAMEVVFLLSRFKNPAFHAEREWRLICARSEIEGKVVPKFRTSSLGVVPYYEFYIGESDKRERLPILSVTVGPSPYANVSDMALKQFLHVNGYNVETQYSTIPIRR